MSSRHVGVCILVALLLPFHPGAASSVEPRSPLEDTLPPFLAVATPEADVDPSRAMEVVVALRLRDEAGLRARVAAGEPPLPHAALVERHAPLAADVEEVARWLEVMGLPVVAISSDRTLLEVRATAGALERALDVDLRAYRVGERLLVGHASAPLLPARILTHVQTIVGLTEAPLFVLQEGAGTQDAGQPPYGAQDLQTAYDVTSVLAAGWDGSGRVAAITSWGGASAAALAEYDAAYGLPAVTLSHVNASGGTTCGPVDLEWDLGVQMMHALAPRASLRVYCSGAASLAGMLSITGSVVSEDLADVVAQSWGTCEPYVSSGTASAYDTKYLEAAAQGQAFFTGSGDAGSRECSRFDTSDQRTVTSFPATAPHTTSVGATRMTMADGSYQGETAWSSCTPCSSGIYQASGGGVSLHFAKPSWQAAPEGATMRASPDVSAVGDPATGVRARHQGAWYTVGGTSVSTPLVAGMWADVVERHGRLGHANERFWRFAGDAAVLRDVTSGSNGDHAAGPGYDLVTGLGSPRVAGLLAALTPIPAPANLTATGAHREVRLVWDAPPDLPPDVTLTGYRVYRGPDPGRLALRTTVGAAQTSFTDTELPDGARYHYAVSSVADSAESPASAIVFAITNGPPSAPTAFAASAVSGGVSLAWGPPASDGGAPVTGYVVESAAPPAGGYGAAPPRVLGGERFVLQLDADDLDAPSSGMARDASPLAQHATILGATATPGRFEGALRLGAGRAVSVPEAGVALPQGAITAWVRPESEGPGGANLILVKQKPGDVDDLRFRLGPGRRLELQMDPSTPALVGSALPLGEWTHVAATWGPAGQRLYVDAALDASSAITAGVGGAYTETMVGNSPATLATTGFDGVLDDVREFSVQLGSEDVRRLAMAPYEGMPVLVESVAGMALHEAATSEAPSFYQVRAENSYGQGEPAPLRAAAGLQSAAAPRSVEASATAPGAITVQWLAPAAPAGEVLGYQVLRGTSLRDLAPLVEVGATTFVDEGLPAGVRRAYQVRALTAAGAGDASLAALGRAWGAPTLPPVGLAVARDGPGNLSLSWSPPEDDGGALITAYIVHAGGSPATLAPLARVENATGFVERGLSADATRHYAVSAVNAVGEGPQGAPVAARTHALPSVPASLAAVPGVRSVGLTWGAAALDGRPLLAFRVYGGTAAAQLSLLAETGATSFTHEGLDDGRAYFYRVSAVTDVGEGAAAAANATTHALPAAPVLSRVDPGPGRGEITLRWSAPATGGSPIVAYRVYASNASGGPRELVREVTGTTMRETGLPDAHARTYEVSAVTAVGEGPRSAARSGATFERPAAPGDLREQLELPRTANHLEWTPPGNYARAGVASYRVYRGYAPDALELLAEVPAGARGYDDTTCPLANHCYYRVSAVGPVGESPLSGEASGIGRSTRLRLPDLPA